MIANDFGLCTIFNLLVANFFFRRLCTSQNKNIVRLCQTINFNDQTKLEMQELGSLYQLCDQKDLRACVFHTQGRRSSMEDTHISAKILDGRGGLLAWLFAVCDGHGGSECAKFLKKNGAQIMGKHVKRVLDAPEKAETEFTAAFGAIQSAWEKYDEVNDSGSTCVMMIYYPNKRQFYIVNSGDSRCLAFKNLINHSSQQIEPQFDQISIDHSPGTESERSRIEQQGGEVRMDNTVARVNGILSVSRSFGDNYLRPFIIEKPDVFGPFEASPNSSCNKNSNVVNDVTNSAAGYYDTVLLACDGLFETLRNQQIFNFMEHVTAADEVKAESVCRQCLILSSQAGSFAYENGSGDNISCMLIHFCSQDDTDTANNVSDMQIDNQ